MNRLLLLSLLFAAVQVSHGRAAEETVLGAVLDFGKAEARPLSPLQWWRWSEEDKARAGEFSRVEMTHSEGRNCYRLVLNKDFVWAKKLFRLMTLDTFYFPPETDAVRVHCKVLKGQFKFSVGGPTAYYANSDVYAAVKALEPTPEWQVIEFSLHDRLFRNLRRSSYSTHAPRIYYNRWSQ